MTADKRRYVVTAIRGVLVLTGAVVTVAVLYSFSTMPTAAASGDSFVRGLSYLFGSVFFVLALGGAGLGLALPSLLGADDALAFDRWQRRCLQAAGGLFVGGFVVGLATGLLTELPLGLLLWLVASALAVLVVSCVLVWRLFAVFVTALVRLIAAETGE
ncbi:hypothetical protein AMS69_08445 [Haloarcula rubripromontorii]|uniref:Uncharacterized protein n=1 Tax=Haloarcula rubripromontorii TaxID=1705562 RepID=A0A0M9AMM7_9EURY|nr:hypothetical protein [Haloarcula rubripromontorii]KOX93935.1 hypothetical protein AMS69_08445 [Haloarcula rubripromontorii]NLV05843.1 hypothetical protein [Haloarcula rubripromontorii]